MLFEKLSPLGPHPVTLTPFCDRPCPCDVARPWTSSVSLHKSEVVSPKLAPKSFRKTCWAHKTPFQEAPGWPQEPPNGRFL